MHPKSTRPDLSDATWFQVVFHQCRYNRRYFQIGNPTLQNRHHVSNVTGSPQHPAMKKNPSQSCEGSTLERRQGGWADFPWKRSQRTSEFVFEPLAHSTTERGTPGKMALISNRQARTNGLHVHEYKEPHAQSQSVRVTVACEDRDPNRSIDCPRASQEPRYNVNGGFADRSLNRQRNHNRSLEYRLMFRSLKKWTDRWCQS